MKKLLALLIILVCLNTKAQTNVYQPFPKDSAVWFYISSTPSGETLHWNKWLGDTIINSKTYTKTFGSVNGTTWSYSGGVRQDIPNQKMYTVNLSGNEQDVSVNQYLHVGDTLPTSAPHMLITSIDSVLVGGLYHKEYNATDTVINISQTYIVGVGTSIRSDGDANQMLSLGCFSVNSIDQFGGGSFCQLTTDIKQVSVYNEHISVYPNPSNGIFQLALSNEQVAEIKIYDVAGKLVYSEFTNGHMNIDANHLSAGIYTISILCTEGFSTKKLVIIK